MGEVAKVTVTVDYTNGVSKTFSVSDPVIADVEMNYCSPAKSPFELRAVVQASADAAVLEQTARNRISPLLANMQQILEEHGYAVYRPDQVPGFEAAAPEHGIKHVAVPDVSPSGDYGYLATCLCDMSFFSPREEEANQLLDAHIG